MAMSDLFPIIYQKSFQETFNKKNIGLKVANFRESNEINNVGDTLKDLSMLQFQHQENLQMVQIIRSMH